MREELKKYLEMLGGDEAAQEKLKSLDKDDTKGAIAASIEIAKGYGIDLVQEDFEEKARELEEDELQAVAGGATACACAGAGYGTSGDGYYGSCYCAVGGAGDFYESSKKKRTKGFCRCFFGGGGGAS